MVNRADLVSEVQILALLPSNDAVLEVMIFYDVRIL